MKNYRINICLLLAIVIAGAVIAAYFSMRFGFILEDGFKPDGNEVNVTFTKVCMISWHKSVK